MRLHDGVIQTEFTKFEGAKIRLRYDAFNQLVLCYEGTEWERVKPLRPFPLSTPNRCVFFRDKEGMEIGYVADVNELDRETRVLLEKELEFLYFATNIDTISDVKARHGVTSWNIKTGRGEKTIHVRDRNDIRTLPGRRMLFTDSNGMRFEIANTDKIDAKSQGFLEAET
jgi:hypothetical protein